MCIKSDAKNRQQYQKWLFAVIMNRDGADAESPFPLFFSFSASFKNSSPRKKVGKLSSFWDWWAESLFVSIIVAKYIIFPRANNGRSREKKNSGEAICSRYQRALSGFWARFRILNLIARLCWLCYNNILFRHMTIIDCHSLWLAETKYFVRVYMHERCHTISRTSLSFLFPSFSPTSVHDF